MVSAVLEGAAVRVFDAQRLVGCHFDADLREFEFRNFGQCAADDAVKVAVKTGDVDNGAILLLVTFRPQALNGSLFRPQVLFHRYERFNDSCHPLAKPGAG